MCIVKIFWYSYSGSHYFASKIQAMIHLQVPLEFPATLGEGDLWLIKMQTVHKRFIHSTASVHLWNSNTFAKISPSKPICTFMQIFAPLKLLFVINGDPHPSCLTLSV